MDVSFLSGQFELMLNLVKNYFEHVEIKDWIMLENVIKNKKSYLESIIHNSEKPIIKKKAKELFPELIYKLKNSIKIKLNM